jgi:hypothetical protein
VDANVTNHRVIDYGTKVPFAQSVWEAVRTSFVGHVSGDERTVCAGISISEFQARAEVEAVAFDALANSEVVDPPRVEAGNSVFSSLSQFLHC